MREEEELKKPEEDKLKVVLHGDSSYDSSLVGLKQDSALLRAMNWDDFQKIDLKEKSEEKEELAIADS